MKAELLKREGNLVTLKIAVEYANFNEAIEKVYKKTKGKYNIPGFRKGKAPRKIIEMNYGKGIFYGDAIDAIFEEVFEKAVNETGVAAIGRPSIDIEEISEDNGLVMLVEVEVKPEVKLGDYKGLEVKKEVAEITDETVQLELDRMAEQNSRLVDVERAVEDGDIVTIDFKGFVDGKEFEGGNAEGYELTIGSDTFIDTFEDQLKGKALNEEVEVNVTFPEGYAREDLAGKPAKFEVKINAIKVKELPEINDEFAADTTEFETLAELKADIKSKLEEEAEAMAESQVRNEIVKLAAEKAEFETPETMVEAQLSRMMNELAFQLQSQGLQMEQLLEITGKSIEGLKDERREDAEQIVRGSLVLEAIGAAEGIEASEEETDAEIAKMAEMYRMEVEEVKKALRPEDIEDIAGQVKIRKTIDFLVENAKLV